MDVLDPSDVHVDRPLERFSVKYMNPESIWRDVAPIVDVDHRSDQFRRYHPSTGFRNVNDLLAAGAPANEIEISSTLEDFVTQDRGLGLWLPGETIRNSSDDPLMPLQDGIMEIRDSLDNQKELRVAEIAFDPATYMSSLTTQLTGNARWDNAASDPLRAMLNAMVTMIVKPNTLVIGAEAWNVLRQHARVAAAIYPMGGNAGAGGSAVTQQAVANYLGLSRVSVGQRWLDMAPPGADDPDFERVWGNHAALIYVNPSPGLYRRNFLTSFVETRSVVVREWDRKRGVRGELYLKDAWTETTKLVAPFAGYLFQDVIS